MERLTRLLLGAALLALLAGCGGGEPEEIREWMRTNSANLKGKIPDLPQIKPLPAVAYDPGDLASPFVPEKLVGADMKAAINQAGGRDRNMAANPDAFPLSRTPLENIRMIGTITVGKDVLGIVASDRDSPRRVKIGDYVGKNYGRITAIRPAGDGQEGEIEVVELVLENGGMVERMARITQPVQGGNK